MPPTMLAKKLKIKATTIRNFMVREQLTCYRSKNKEITRRDKVPFGYFDVDERENWLTGQY
jgi:phage antirepressor YoqD-like protein